ncbi:hypothetical protein [Paraglaciecola chathamensis]|jgi:hypothetical protein|uniref:Uncharacterized protein n=3 Tax=Paraglaciecola chathamensis TaxID=368405 RepID=A0A8H9ICD3_9ALTE|nr:MULTISPECIES: hypothetical protein [Paraglaciecola]AEE23815.1 hypothetical protein Glaag_2878 [Glaciecola sp. 4H-3-7+YE-5]MBU3016855.1 hypothetical protein [Paraglaciecola agarilytica]MDO6558081.1 hypothetical protein [Paraglaciecola chathamensis]MDO6839749.1 hypothetical protein [Paraglaciecola chathamensis]GAC04627.1 hypothetical protein GAGA_1772 [Paraglaciecola agarilytica NO2]|tara:strand:+ start:83 stop:274 length:192 start_codon:yes stop_codon:yes gene_type:complete
MNNKDQDSVKKDDDTIDKDDALQDSEAEAGSPIAESIAGEEDPGSALEEFMKDQKVDEDQEKK